MAAQTQLQIVNRVLRRLRENTVTSIGDTEYSQLIADFLNQTVEEVGSAHNWSVDRANVVLYFPATGAGTYTSAAGLSEGSTYLLGNGLNSNRAIPLVDENNLPICYAGYDLSALEQIPHYAAPEVYERILRERTYGGGEAYRREAPEWFRYEQNSNGWTIYFDPGVELHQDFYIQSFWTDQQETKEVDGTQETETFRYDDQLLAFGTLLLALNERGEELGEPGNMAERQYERALATAIHSDSLTTQQLTNNLDWRRD